MISELTSTRANPLVDPSLHVWGWQIPVYLFLGGLVAGMMILSGWSLLSGAPRRDRHWTVLPLLGLALLSLGMLALFLDLEHKLFVWRLYTTFMVRSPMSWGAWILVLVYPALALLLLAAPPRWLARAPLVSAAAERLAPARRGVATLAVALGVALGVYTGILLSALGARPLWSSAALGPLFLASGLSSAAALMHLLLREPAESDALARADNLFLGIELALLALFFIGLASASRAGMQAAGLFFGGPFTAVFWVGVVGLGIVLPLAVQLLALGHRIRHTPVAPLLVLAGGLLLRLVIVYAGQLSRWTA